MTMKSVWNVVEGLKPAMLMVVSQIAGTGLNVLYKVVVDDGMNLRILVAYRFIFAALFIAPLALILERNTRPKMTWTILFQAFLCGLFGGLMTQNLYLKALALTSATFVSAIVNLTPAATFLMAVFFRLEKLNLGTIAGKAKIIGTIIGISGAMVITFFKGIEINTGSFHITLLHNHNGHVASPQSSSSSGGNTLLGSLSALGSCFSYALWLIIQAKMSKSYTCYYSITALMNLMGSLICTAFAICLERDWTQWKLGWNILFLTAAYSGIIISGVMTVVTAWCVHRRGPLYASSFSPLLLVFVAFVGSFMLNEKLHLGSIIGGVLIVCGLYVIIWAKDREMKNMNQLRVSSQSLHEFIVISPAEDNCEIQIVIKDQEHSSENASEVAKDR